MKLPPEAERLAAELADGVFKGVWRATVAAVVKSPQHYWDDPRLGPLARALQAPPPPVIHQRLADACSAQILASLTSVHNLARRETHDGRPLIVHRKGAIPLAAGELGIVAGTATSPTFVVRGKGHPEALDSASHGTGRWQGRGTAHKQQRKGMRKSASATCKAAGVLLINAREDEHPEIYRDIHATLEQQAELLEPIARFEPRLVHMARHGEPPED